MVNYSFFSEEKIFIFMLIVSIIEYTSSEEFGCTLNYDSGNGNQKQILKNLNNHTLFGKSFHCKIEDELQYNFVICGDVRQEMPNVSLEKVDLLQNKKTPIGYRSSTDVIGMTGHGAWALLTFSIPKNDPPKNDSGKNSTTASSCQNHSSVMIVCDLNFPDGDFKFGYFDKDLCQYVFELRIAALCQENSHMSGFSIFLIILVVAFALYFICGVFYKRIQLGAKGIDQIPHRQFWFGLGNKFADCFNAMCRCDQYCSDPEHLETHSQYSGGYSPIGEAAGKQPGMSSSSPIYERDSQLINP